MSRGIRSQWLRIVSASNRLVEETVPATARQYRRAAAINSPPDGYTCCCAPQNNAIST